MIARRLHLVALLLAVLATAGCAGRADLSRSLALESGDGVRECLDFHAALDREVRATGVLDGAASPVRGADWLRASRWLAAEARDDTPGEAWLKALRDEERMARLAEIANLPEASRIALQRRFGSDDLPSRLVECTARLTAATADAAIDRRALRRAAQPADDYIGWHRVVGLYPLTRFGILAGVNLWQRRVEAGFTTTPPARAAGLRYAPVFPSPDGDGALSRAMADAPRDGLGRLREGSPIVEQLFAAHAPLFEMTEDAPWNRIGTPFLEAAGQPNVYTGAPRVYTHLDHTDYRGEVLPRLHYTIWFSSRPKAHALDILGGRLDGLTIRITLDNQGRPLHLETMHNCGCYQQHYLLGDARARPDHGYAERPLTLPGPPVPGGGERWVFRLQDRTHYVDSISVSDAPASGRPYLLADYGELTRLHHPEGGRVSLFRPDGMVPGTSRDERVLFWVSGVPDPGAMRQLGRHATAFVGRRHFDDPDLLGRVIEIPAP